MSGHAAARAAWAVWAVAMTLAAAGLVLAVLSATAGGRGADVAAADLLAASVNTVAMVAFATVGAFVVASRPQTAVGWAFLALGAVIALRSAAFEYAVFGLVTRPGSLPSAAVVAAVGAAVGQAPFALTAISMLLFPDGSPPSPRWRRVPWIVGATALAGGLALLTRPGLLEAPFGQFANPLGLGSQADLFDAVTGLGWLAMMVAMLAAGVAMVGRLRRARGLERQQLKWVAFAAAIFGAAFVGITASFFAELSGDVLDALRRAAIGVGYVSLPVAAGIAILHHRLYDIDVVINRTLVYGALTAALAGIYLGSVLLLQFVLGALTAGNDLAIAGSTLAVAALFRPARRSIQSSVDRRFYRHRYDAARTLAGFGSRLRDEVDIEAVGGGLRAVVAQTMQPAHVSLWLRDPGSAR